MPKRRRGAVGAGGLPTGSGVRRLSGVGVLAVLAAGVWVAAPEYRTQGVRAAAAADTLAAKRALSPVSACLLTGASGVGRAPASLVWAGVQGAGSAAGARVSFLPLPARAASGPVVNALVAQRCSVIVGVGDPAVAAVRAAAPGHPVVRWAVAGASDGRVVGFDPTTAAAQKVVEDLLARSGSEK